MWKLHILGSIAFRQTTLKEVPQPAETVAWTGTLDKKQLGKPRKHSWEGILFPYTAAPSLYHGEQRRVLSTQTCLKHRFVDWGSQSCCFAPYVLGQFFYIAVCNQKRQLSSKSSVRKDPPTTMKCSRVHRKWGLCHHTLNASWWRVWPHAHTFAGFHGKRRISHSKYIIGENVNQSSYCGKRCVDSSKNNYKKSFRVIQLFLFQARRNEVCLQPVFISTLLTITRWNQH